MERCSWANARDALLCAYHDEEYGRIKRDDTALFEKLCLECFQAGLSWRIVLQKREALRRCFYGFDPQRMARMTPGDVEALLRDTRIIRNKKKIEAVINNAARHSVLFASAGSFFAYVYSFQCGKALSESLKRRGYRFAGPVVCTSFLMSVGAIEGHEKTCDLYKGEDTTCRHI